MSIQTIGNSSGYEMQNYEKPLVNTSGLKKEISDLEKKLKLIKQDMQQYQSDKAKGALGIDEMMNKLRQTYQKISSELSSKKIELQHIEKNNQSSNQSQNVKKQEHVDKVEISLEGQEALQQIEHTEGRNNKILIKEDDKINLLNENNSNHIIDIYI